MANKTGKILAGLAAIAVMGAIAYAASDDGEPGVPHDEIGSGGMVLSGDCDVVTVEDVGAYMTAWLEFVESRDILSWFDADDLDDVAQLMIEFLGIHFPGCFPPEPGPDFRWVTTLPTTQSRTWEQVLHDMQAMLEMVPDGFEGAGAGPYDWEEFGNAAATTPEEPPQYGSVIGQPGSMPVPTPDPPFPSPEGQWDPGSGPGGWHVVPDNVLQAVTPANMVEGGIGRAMENDGALSPQPSTVVVVFDRDWPGLDEMSEKINQLGRDNPDVLFLLANTQDTRIAFGKPEHPGEIAFAVNASDRKGQYRDPEAVAFPWETEAMSNSRWQALVDHALSPYAASFTART